MEKNLGAHELYATNTNEIGPFKLQGKQATTNISPDPREYRPDNLYADLSKSTGITINDLRQAIAYQQMLEKDARSGTRYVEFLKSHFGVDSPDARQQRSEYLGGLKQPMGVNQIPQTNSTDATTPQANLAAYGESKLQHNSFKKTFTEHGYVIGIAIVRYNHTYQQGLERA